MACRSPRRTAARCLFSCRLHRAVANRGDRLQNKALVYDILFKAAAQTIRVIAADPKHLGAETGMIAILHTWGRPSPIIPMFTASCRAAASDRTGAGSNASGTS